MYGSSVLRALRIRLGEKIKNTGSRKELAKAIMPRSQSKMPLADRPKTASH
jgi:hypothetical protein